MAVQSTPDGSNNDSIFRLVAALVAGAVLVFAVYASVSFAANYRPPKLVDKHYDSIMARGEIVVATDASYPPFAFVRDGAYAGYDVQLARKLAERLGLRVQIVNMSSDGLYDAIKVGRVNIAISALPPVPELQKDFSYSMPYFDDGQVIVVRSDSDVKTAADLNDRTVGVELGSTGDMIARRLQEDDQSIVLSKGYHTPEEALDALYRAEVDSVITDRVSALTYTHREKGLKIVPDQLTNEPYVIAMPVDSPKLLGAINGALSLMASNGELDQIARDNF